MLLRVEIPTMRDSMTISPESNVINHSLTLALKDSTVRTSLDLINVMPDIVCEEPVPPQPGVSRSKLRYHVLLSHVLNILA
jgi:hypothetical protein